MAVNIAPTDLSSGSHIGIVVKDADKTAKFLSSLGVGPWHTFEYELTRDTLISGEPFKIKNTWSRLWGQVFLEVIQPLDEVSLFANFLKSNGEGIHHIAFSVSNWDEIVSKIREQGGKMLVGGIVQGKRWCYMVSDPGNIVLEPMEDDLHDKAFQDTE